MTDEELKQKLQEYLEYTDDYCHLGSEDEINLILDLFSREAMIRVSRIDVLSGYDTSSMDEMFEVLNALPKREKRRLI